MGWKLGQNEVQSHEDSLVSSTTKWHALEEVAKEAENWVQMCCGIAIIPQGKVRVCARGLTNA